MSIWLSAGLAIVVFAIYAAIPTKNYYWDGVGFSVNIEWASGLRTGDLYLPLIHPNHLLYNPLGYALWSAIRAAASGVRAHEVLQAINIILGPICVLLIQRLLFRITHSGYLSTTLALLFAFSATFWRFTTDADAYIPSLLCLLLAYYVATESRKSRPIIVGLLHAFAMLIHQLAAIFFPAAALGIYRKGGCRSLFRYSLVAIGITLPAYYAGFCIESGQTNPRDFLHWLTSHSAEVSFTFGVRRNLAITLASYVQLFVGGRMSLMRRFFGPWTAIALGFLVVVLVCMLMQVIRFRAELYRFFMLRAEYSPVAAIWLLCYAVFLFFWLPHNTFYKLFALPAIFVLAGYKLRAYRGPRRYRLALLTAAVALLNLAFVILPYSHTDSNQSLRFGLRMHDQWPKGTVVYFSEFGVDDWFLRYFNPQTNWKTLHPADVPGFFRSANQDIEQGREVWIDPSAAAALVAQNANVREHFQAVQEDRDPKHWVGCFRWKR